MLLSNPALKFNFRIEATGDTVDLLSEYDFFYHVKVLRKSGKEIIGFELNSDETMHLRFNKIE